MPHPLSLHQLAVMELTPPELIRTAHAAGFDKVCLFTQGMDGSGFTFPLVTRGQSQRDTQAALDETGIKVNHIEVFFLHPEVDVTAYRAGLELGAELGGRTATAIIGDPEATRAADNFGKLCELANSVGIRPAIEFMKMSTIDSIEKAAEIGRLSGHPAGCIALDTLHLIRTGGGPDALAKIDPAAIGSVQINDGPLAMPEDRQVWEAMQGRLLPGQGEFPLADIIGLLPADITLSVECPNDEQRAEHADVVAFARNLHRAARAALGATVATG